MMKNKPKNAFKIALATFLGLSVACVSFVGFKPILSRADRIEGTIIDPNDTQPDSGVTFHQSLFNYYGFDITLHMDLEDSGLLDNYVEYTADFMPFLPVSRTATDSYDSFSNTANYTYTEDIATFVGYSSHTFNFGDSPVFDPDIEGGIADDEVVDIYASDFVSMESVAGTPSNIAYAYIGKRSNQPVFVADIGLFLSSLSDLDFTRFQISSADSVLRGDFYLSYMYFDPSNELQISELNVLDYLTDPLGADFHFPYVNNDSIPTSCFLLDCYVFLEIDIGQGNNEFGIDYTTFIPFPTYYDVVDWYQDDFDSLDSYISSNQTINHYTVPTPTEMLFDPVETFLKTEFIEGFSFGTLLLVSLGFLAFWLFLKVFVGG